MKENIDNENKVENETSEIKEIKKYEVYNFDRPDKFSFEHLKSLDSIFSAFSRNFATVISSYLRMPTEIELTKVEQIPFASEFLEKSEKDYYAYCITDMNKEQFIIRFDVGFLLRVHAKQLGGQLGKVEKVKKNITEFEKITITHLLNVYMHPQLKESLKNIGEFEFHTFGIETDPQYARVTLPQDMVAQLTFQVKVGNEYTTFLIVLPYLSIEKYISKFKTDNVLRNRQLETSLEQIEYLNKNILQVKEDFIVNVGKTTITLKDMMLLSVGDVLILDDVSKGASAELKGKKKFLGKIGMNDKKFSFKITGML